MIAGSCTLHPLAGATRNNGVRDATGNATPDATGAVRTPMTGRELRAQLRAQLACNAGPEPCNRPSVAALHSAGGAMPEQAVELRRLVGIVAADWPADEQAEALAAALADPADALRCFRALVAHRSAPEPTGQEQTDDGMRPCVECASLSPGGRCLAAFRGDLPGYPRGYSPALTDRPQRCAGYAPGPDDPDRRTGRERWPLLLNVAEGSP